MNSRPYPHRRHSSHRPTRHGSSGHSGQRQCIALVDWKFVSWLASNTQGEGSSLSREQLQHALRASVDEAGLGLYLRNVWVYSEQDDAAALDDQQLKVVAAAPGDGGLTVVRAMAADLLSLARRESIENVLIASDDERLAVAIDEARLSGMNIAMLVDEAAAQPARLAQEDASWARLLRLADRRVVALWNGSSNQTDYSSAAAGEPAVDVAPIFLELVQNWWSDLPQEDRDELSDTLPLSRGVPQEVDRELLQLARNRMERPLSLPEKRVLRQALRHVALGEEGQESAGLPSDPESDE